MARDMTAETALSIDPVLCLQHGEAALALLRVADRSLVYASAAFERLLPPPERAALLAGLDPARPRREVEMRVGSRQLCLDISLRLLEGAHAGLAVLTLSDIGGQREAEYVLDSYAKLAERHARDLEREKTRAEKLLLNMMPRSVYEELREYGTTTPQRFEHATVLMLDLVGFTEMSMAREPSQLVAELNDIFSAFDRVVELFGCERIKTIGDAYLAVSGVPEPSPEHVVNAAKVALRMRRYLDRRNASGPQEWKCRIGIATGPLIGSVVGIHRYVYDVFGPAVNMAARLEATAKPGEILLCNNAMLQLGGQFEIGPAQMVELKGFGSCAAAALIGEQRHA